MEKIYFKELFDVSSGLSKGAKELANGDNPFLTFKTIFNNTFLPDEIVDKANTNESEQEKYSVRKGDIFLTRTSETMDELGMSSVALKDYPGAVFNGFSKRLRLKNNISISIDLKYLGYFLRSRLFRDQVDAMSNTSTRASLNIEMINRLYLLLPDISTQKRIGSTLYLLEEKIKNNNETNQNLEEQLLGYYRELFVINLDPSWKTATVSDLGKVVGGSTPSKKNDEYYTSDGIAWITPKDLSNDHSKFIAHGENDITELGLANSSAVCMPKGTVLFSSRAPIGYIAIADGVVTTNQGFKSVVPFDEIGTAFVYCFLKENLNVIENMASGSTFKEISGSTMKTVPAFIPDTNTMTKFRTFADTILEKQKNNEAENKRLATIRDVLLPKLMTGEIDLSDVKL